MDDRQYQYAEPPQAQDVIDPFAAEHPINNEPFVRYCRNCGEKVEPGASVCVHCNYVLDVVTLQRAQRMQRVRYEQAQRQARRNRGLLGVLSDTVTRVLVGEQPRQSTASNQTAKNRKTIFIIQSENAIAADAVRKWKPVPSSAFAADMSLTPQPFSRHSAWSKTAMPSSEPPMSSKVC